MKRPLFITIMFMFLLPLSLIAKGLSVTRITCEHKDGLVITDNNTPKLGWQLVSNENGTKQSAYEIEVYNKINNSRVYSSKKVITDSSQLIPVPLYEGKFTWRVRVWDESDNVSCWSNYQSFIIENSQKVFGNSVWIGAVPNAKYPNDTLSNRSIFLRKDFSLHDKVKQAYVYVCGLGFYELSINARKVGDSEFAPLWSNYDKSVFYNTYDVTEYVRQGINAIQAILGNGFYNERGGRYHKLITNYGPPTLRLRLEIIYENEKGKEYKTSEIVTDNSWKYAVSPITFNSIYGGEDYDARLETPAQWLNVVFQCSPKGILRPQYAEPVKIMETYGVKSITRLSEQNIVKACISTKRTVDKSAFVLDMGQNLAGYPQFTVTGTRGQEITILVSETLTEQGACNQKQTGRPYYYVYTLRGGKPETWHPRFSYYGFQYIQVEGAVMKGQPNPNNLPVINEIHSCFVYNSAREISTFECSNDLINKTHRLIERAVRSNMQAVFTDCPHREKLGWLEQDYLNGTGLALNYDLPGFIEQTMQNISDAQMDNGAIPTTAPEYVIFKGPGVDVFRESPEWSGTFIYLPFLYYEKYHDDTLIHKYYPAMKRYIDYLKSRAKDNILDFGLGDWYDYGPGKSGFSKNTPISLVATAHYYLWVKYIMMASSFCHNDSDFIIYRQLANDIIFSFNKHFYNKVTHQYGSGSQTSNAIPLTMKLNYPTEEPYLLANLIADIQKHGNRLTTGDVGNLYLFRALSQYGKDSLLYLMINHYDVPGYGYQIKQGATTLTEQWDPNQGASRNHFMMGQIDEFFFTSLAGIPDFGPRIIGDITYVNASTENIYGKLSAFWILKGNVFTYNIKVPVGGTANVKLPGENVVRTVGSGRYTFTVKLKKGEYKFKDKWTR